MSARLGLNRILSIAVINGSLPIHATNATNVLDKSPTDDDAESFVFVLSGVDIVVIVISVTMLCICLLLCVVICCALTKQSSADPAHLEPQERITLVQLMKHKVKQQTTTKSTLQKHSGPNHLKPVKSDTAVSHSRSANAASKSLREYSPRPAAAPPNYNDDGIEEVDADVDEEEKEHELIDHGTSNSKPNTLTTLSPNAMRTPSRFEYASFKHYIHKMDDMLTTDPDLTTSVHVIQNKRHFSVHYATECTAQTSPP